MSDKDLGELSITSDHHRITERTERRRSDLQTNMFDRYREGNDRMGCRGIHGEELDGAGRGLEKDGNR